jgi:hypothetical protein
MVRNAVQVMMLKTSNGFIGNSDAIGTDLLIIPHYD